MILSKTVDIKSYGIDRFNRVLEEIYLIGKNINLEMVKVGLAEIYQEEPVRGLDLTAYREAEAKAQEARTGMWSLRCG